MKKLFSLYTVPFLCAIPSALVGGVCMWLHGISMAIYIQNLVALIMCCILSILYLACKKELRFNRNYVGIIICVLLLCSTFISSGIEGVQRWLQVGFLNLHAAYIILPFTFIFLNCLFKTGCQRSAYAFIVGIACILFLQPDASMFSAFAIAIVPMVVSEKQFKLLGYGLLVVLSMLSVFSWLHLDSLSPVSYVEGILVLAKECGWLYLLLGVISLLILFYPFIKKDNIHQSHTSMPITFGLFFAILIISSLTGHFPVPVMGYGISPIIGYMISATYVQKNRIKDTW